MRIFPQLLFAAVVALLVSCKRHSAFQVVNYSDADWEAVDPFDAKKMFRSDFELILNQYLSNPKSPFSEEEMQILYKRLLKNCQFFHPNKGWPSTLSMPLLSRGKPETLTDENTLKTIHLLQAWSDTDLLQSKPEPIGEDLVHYFSMIGLKFNLDGIASVLQADKKPKTAMQSVILLAIRGVLADWNNKGEAELFWWTFKGKCSLLYITQRVAFIFYENTSGKVEVIHRFNVRDADLWKTS